MASQWYYAQNGVQHGPVDSKTLRRLAASEDPKPDDYVWKEGMTEWKEANCVKGLVFKKVTTPPPVSSPPPVDSPTQSQSLTTSTPDLAEAAKGLFTALKVKAEGTGKKIAGAVENWQRKVEEQAAAVASEPPVAASSKPVVVVPATTQPIQTQSTRSKKVVSGVGCASLVILVGCSSTAAATKLAFVVSSWSRFSRTAVRSGSGSFTTR